MRILLQGVQGLSHVPHPSEGDSPLQACCHACDQAAVGRCRQCDRPYCSAHGVDYCIDCVRLFQLVGKSVAPSELGRAVLWGALLGFPTLVIGFCTGFTWDGETSEEVQLGVLLWPIWIAYTLVPIRGFGWLFIGPLVQWAGYTVLVLALRWVYRGLGTSTHKDMRQGHEMPPLTTGRPTDWDASHSS